MGSDEAKNGSGQQSLSKSALKKLAKRQSWLDTKAERKAIQKQKRKAKVEQNKAEGKYEISYSGTDSIKFFDGKKLNIRFNRCLVIIPYQLTQDT